MRRWRSVGEHRATPSLEEALVELKRDPATAVRARVEGMEVELGSFRREARRAGGSSELPEMPTTKASADMLGGATWHGQSAAELIQIIHDGREIDDPAEERSDRVESPGKIL